MPRYGDGTTGKRLWIRTKNKRWIEIPYGAGQDEEVRSVNVWDGTRWNTPAYYRRESNNLNTPVPSLNIYLPGVSWVGPEDSTSPSNVAYWNPNYETDSPQRSSELFTPEEPNWIRLFHLAERNDPTWRIVALGRQLPMHAPNRTVHLPEEKRYFFPSASYRRTTVTGTRTTRNDFSVAGSGFPLPKLCFASAEYGIAALTTPRSTKVTLDQECVLFDLAAIRKRLETDYEHQNEDFTGQYNSIKKMSLRRVVVDATVQSSAVVMLDKSDDPALVDSALAAIRVSVTNESNADTAIQSMTEVGWNAAGEYHDLDVDLQVPINATPRNTLVAPRYTVTGADMPVTQVAPTSTQIYVSVVRTDLVTWVFEEPGESNLALYGRVTGSPFTAPPLSDHLFYALGLIRATPLRVTLHYADLNADTPAELHNQTRILG